MWGSEAVGLEANFREHFRGLFKLESTSTVIMESMAEFDAAWTVFSSLPMKTSIDRISVNFEGGVLASIDSVQPVLTYLHEQDHFKMLCSTPIGLLLWRMEQCLSVEVHFLRHRLPALRPDGFPTFLDAWITAARGLRDTDRDGERILGSAVRAGLLRLFLELVLGRRAVTVGMFVDVANHAFEFLAALSGITIGNHPRWESGLDPQAPLLTGSSFTLVEIVEASARATELTNLEAMGLAQSVLDQWHTRNIFGVYEPAFRFLMSELGSPIWCKIAVDIALGSAMDLSAGKGGDVIRVEDVLPSYRLPRIVAALRRRTWNPVLDQATLQQLYEELPRDLGLPPVSDLYAYMAQAEYSLQANWGGKIMMSGKDGTVTPPPKEMAQLTRLHFGAEAYVKFIEEQYRRNFQLRVRNRAHFISYGADTVNEPVLTFFRDQLRVCTEHLGGSLDLAYGSFQQFCSRENGRSYMYQDTMVDLTRYKQLFREWCVGAGEPASLVDGVLRAQEMIEATGGITIKELADAFEQYISECESNKFRNPGTL